jgi:ferritin-like metal-binding protein YciE
MPSIDSMTELLVAEIRDLYDAEKRLTKAIPRMAKKASNPELKTALTNHLKETEGQVRRLERVFRHLGETPRGKACAGMRGIVEEGDEHVAEDYGDPSLRDTMIIGSAQRVEHYEMAAYMGAISHARLLGLDEVKDLLEETLEEEEAADKKLMAIAESSVSTSAPKRTGEEEGGGITAGLADIVKRTFGSAEGQKSGGREGARKRGGAKRSGARRGAKKR